MRRPNALRDRHPVPFRPESRHCRYCQGAGCVHCPAETERAYKEEFPNGPPPAISFKFDSPADMEALTATMGMANLAKGNRHTRQARLARELENVERVRAGLPPIEPNAELAELEAMTDEEYDASAAEGGNFTATGRVFHLILRGRTNEHELPPRVIPKPDAPPAPDTTQPIPVPYHLHKCATCGTEHYMPSKARAWGDPPDPYPTCCGKNAKYITTIKHRAE